MLLPGESLWPTKAPLVNGGHGVKLNLPAWLDRCNFGPAVKKGRNKFTKELKDHVYSKINDFAKHQGVFM